MLLSDFEYELPEELIAQEPLPNREDSRMLAVDRALGSFSDLRFRSFPEFIREGDVVVLNNTKVFPARLIGNTDTGATVELFLTEQIGERIWEALARPAKRLKPGKVVRFGDVLTAEVKDGPNRGRVLAEFSYEGDFFGTLDQVGKTPLPPYIKRDEGTPSEDRSRYQTVYARETGAIAAPTAGFHFTPEILEKVRDRGAETVEITLHVGYGTFEPVREEDLSKHSVQPERFEIRDSESERLNKARQDGQRIVAIGTTTTRALEACISKFGSFVPGKQIADLTIVPGYRFRAIDALLTNFHLPCSSLLVLVSTFGGHELIMRAYNHAVAEKYRFYSYGDCMFLS
ncbi:MAG: tRNA preQ1(34) S-adenosylmethionine ribosyltransferase-isomerase QueA [Acidobacteria bacterium]|nr:MAG: tRNA preQ1(34) S-adenosylmethionine ribosyltransferase-isomerase QueA [Acidobacteriota bacterium]REJ99245.1 MAG: tRNA preQ1(34) S-adenosylmethionine ribosyltransferase-isomerase QueA [Acidobacteriota bacterium]REK16034.1 MAG: tRNA preQ1(34) S-adenosylmethionine ribosyltransferase-isomerase QueA [Acidobacteriota bacterium]REK43715.1 MAG: tRNA preQ1(34) S-adenosylmethionine ribosyltransferase-isomerase QueA [Acidobacteriota bacterium]